MESSQRIAVRLDAPERHTGTIHSLEPLTVESAPEQWAYAISVSLRDALATGPPRMPFTVSTKVTVHSGQLQSLLTAQDLKTPLGPLPPVVSAGSHTLDMLFERDGKAPRLVFRNAGSERQPCVFTVESISISPDEGDSLKWSIGLSDIARGTPPRIAIDDLHRAVVNRDQPLADDVAVLDRLRRKWSTVPAGPADHRSAKDLLALYDEDLGKFWTETHRQTTSGDGFAVRGWYQELYKEALRGRKVLEIGSGIGIDGIEFARHGASVTFVDIIEDNLSVIKRLCSIFSIGEAQFVYLQGFSSLDSLAHDYDVVWCGRSQINTPFDFARRECAAILPHLKTGGRWIERAYPRERWVRDGSPPFRVWGTITDGEDTPWVEWCDLEKLIARLAPARFAPVLAFNFHHDDFNWFDLLKTAP